MAEDVQSVIDRDKNDIPVMCKIKPVKGIFFQSISGKISAAVDPDENRLLFAVKYTWCPDIQVLAVLPLLLQHMQPAVIGRRVRRKCLGGDRPIAIGIFYPRPGL